MRIFVIAFAVIAATSAASISSDYLPPVDDNSLAPSKEYLAPAPSESQSYSSASDDGYRYKTVRKLRLRHRRDVSEIVNKEYLPPNEGSPAASEEVFEAVAVEAAEEESPAAVAVEAPEEKTVLADDGYRYKVVRRLRYRHRRDVNEIPSNDYLPPNQEPLAASEEAVAVEAPVEAPQEVASEAVVVEAPEEKTILADDGYRYKIVRRIRYRHRRDVNELPVNEYLPPNQESSVATEEVVVVEAPVEAASVQSAQEAPVAIEAPEEKTILADDGYRYKVVRRIRYRHRRDVNELPVNEYLPPNQESSAALEEAVAVVIDAPVEVPQQEASVTVSVEAPEEKTVLADDGYRYKVVRRIRYRHRRDVNELPANEYLPPNQESSAASEEAVAVEVPIEAPEEAPKEEASEAVVVEAPEEKTVLANDGYRYKVVRRIRYRHRRDVNELPVNEYLPPSQESSVASEEVIAVEAPVEPAQEEAAEAVVVEAPEEKTVLADDGYRYKVVRRIRYRHRRDVNELPVTEYLPPSQESSVASEEVIAVEAPIEPAQEEASEAVVVEAPEEKTVLADDGYRYKVVRRIRYRHRRDVNELPITEYLPPIQESSVASEEVIAIEAPVEPAQEEASEAVSVEAPEEKTVLADDGYRYKVVRRIRYRHRRDVNELPANEYLPPNQERSAASEEAVVVEALVEPAQEEASEAVAVEAPEEKTVLADDGYRYKVVRRIRYRRH